VGNPLGDALRLAGRPALARRNERTPAVIAHANVGRDGVGKREAAVGAAGRGRLPRPSAAAAPIGAILAGRLVGAAQGGDQQRRRTHQTQKVHSGDYQQKLSLA
jgi:hypothetical protein